MHHSETSFVGHHPLSEGHRTLLSPVRQQLAPRPMTRARARLADARQRAVRRTAEQSGR